MTERVLGPTGSPRRRRTLVLPAIVALAAAVVFGVTAAVGAGLPGSNFEIDTSANLKVDGSGVALDWANVSETRKADKASGSGDDSFGQGAKEDDGAPAVVDGSIPPNKSDLLNFGVYLETTGSGARFLNLFWHRVQEPSGTTNMDFEFNQSGTLSANGVTPVRTAGDLLIQYDLAQGGTNPILFKSVWIVSGAASQCEASNSVPCWGTKTNLSAAGDATGSINTSAIASGDADGFGAISARTFGEAQLDFDALTGGTGSCTSFGSAYLKSRSSDSFTSALKDFIAPTNTNLSNCGQVIIRKQTSPDESSNATNFAFTSNLVTQPVISDATAFQLQDDGSKTMAGVLANTNYNVTESDPSGSGYTLTNIDCSASSANSTYSTNLADRKVTFNVQVGKTIDCTFTNSRLPKVKLVKSLDPTTDTGTFNLDISQGAVSKASASGVGHNGAAPASGFVTVVAGNVTVSETAAGTTSLANYATSISCNGGKGGNSGQTTFTFAVANGDEITCTITNTRRTFTIVSLVCETTSGTPVLYKSTVTLPAGQNSKTTQTSGDAATLCALAANYPGLNTGTHSPQVVIGTSPAP